MNTSKPPSLGDERGPQYTIISEERPLPTTRKEIISAFEAILAIGHVQKVIVELNKPIKFFRAIVRDGDIPKDVVDDDEFANIRNAEIHEFLSITAEPFHAYLFKAFQFLTHRRLKAKSFFFSNTAHLKAALGLDLNAAMTEVFGVDVIKNDEVPTDVLLLSATRHGEESVSLTLRMLLPQRKAP